MLDAERSSVSRVPETGTHGLRGGAGDGPGNGYRASVLPMDRRRFLLTSLAGVIPAPLAAEAQKAGKLSQIGLLGPSTAQQAEPFVAVFWQRMREHGWVEGEHFALDQRWAAGKPKRFADLAEDLVRLSRPKSVVRRTPK
jgi:hypothetical protein